MWLMVSLAVMVLLLVVVAVLAGAPPTIAGGAGGAAVAMIYFLGELLPKRTTTLDINACADAVIDRRNHRIAIPAWLERSVIALPSQDDKKTYWIVVEFQQSFPEVADAVGRQLGERLRAASIGRVNTRFIVFLLLLVLAFLLAFVYFMITAMTAR